MHAECSIKLVASCSGVSSWISKNHDLGIVSSSVGTAVSGIGVDFGVYEGMVPLRAASMENGSAGLLLRVKEGGSTRRKGELDVRRLDRRPTRLCLGEPRLRLMGVEEVVFGEDNALRTEGISAGVEEIPEEMLEMLVLADWDTEVIMNWEGFDSPSLVLERLVGELKTEGSIFSELKSSSKDEGGYRRLPVLDWVGLPGEEKDVGIAIYVLLVDPIK